jgi:hypothetical protein
VDETEKSGVITAYNLSNRVKTIEIEFELKKYDLDISTIEIYNGLNEKFSIKEPVHDRFIAEIPPLSPIIAILRK